MLSEVIKTVAQAKDDLAAVARRKADEADIKNSLIHPILLALGWDVSASERVAPEFQLPDDAQHPVDYALLDRGGTPRALVKVKTERLRDHSADAEQLHSRTSAYLGNKGSKAARAFACIVFTNGRKWHFYPVNAQAGGQHYGHWHLTVDLAEGTAEQCAASLSRLLSESSICAGQAKQHLTTECRRLLVAQEWQRMNTQPDRKLVKLLLAQQALQGSSISGGEAAYVILHPEQALPKDEASGAGALRQKQKRRHKPRTPYRLLVTVGDATFDSVKFMGVRMMVPKVLKAIMKLKGISGEQLVQACVEADITARHSRTWIVSADTLAAFRDSPSPQAHQAVHASRALDGNDDYFVIIFALTKLQTLNLEKLRLALGLGDDMTVSCTPTGPQPARKS